VVNNPSLAPTAFANVDSYSSEIQGNLETAVP